MEEHQACFPGEVSLCNLFIDPIVSSSMPKTCTVFTVSPLLRELMKKAGTIGETYEPEGADSRIMQVIIDELRSIEPACMTLPLGNDPRLRLVTDAMLDKPGDSRTLREWATKGNASPRTLARLFLSETAMTFREWRARLRLLTATEKLSRGEPVGNVAFDLGYLNTSTFIEAFRQRTGVTPRPVSRAESVTCGKTPTTCP